MPDPVAWLIDQLHGPTSDTNKDNKNPLFTNDPAPKGGGGGGGAKLGQSTDPGSALTDAASKALSASGGQAQPFISPLALQLFFTKTIAPMLQGIQGNQQQAIDEFKKNAGGNVDPRQLASMQNVNNAMAGAAAAGPAIDSLMNQVNQVLNAQTKGYYQSLRTEALGGSGGDMAAQLAALLGGGGAAKAPGA